MAHRVEKKSILLPLLFFLSTYVVLLVAGRNYTDECPEMRCKPDGPRVRFPFRIIGKHAPNCGYEGFEIYCSSINDSILHLPDGSANLSVTRIDYKLQQLYVRDEPAYRCLPKKIKSFNLFSSPFQYDPDGAFNATLFNCSVKNWEKNKHLIYYCPRTTSCDYSDSALCNNQPWTVQCSEVDQRYKIIALTNDLSPCSSAGVTSCHKLYETAVTYRGSYNAEPDVILRWSTPDCTTCEGEWGTCIPKKNNFSEPQVDCLIQQFSPYHNNKGSLLSIDHILFYMLLQKNHLNNRFGSIDF
ncbi:hypothetical protein ACFE04_009683 [Oxalis oulophora]